MAIEQIGAAIGWQGLKVLLPRVIRYRKPFLFFGSPRQEAHQETLSWWHVPISIGLSFPGQRNKIEGARIFLVDRRDAEQVICPLRWQFSDAGGGASEITIRRGRTYLVPIARREEPGHGPILPRVTNERWLIDWAADRDSETKHGDYILLDEPSTHEWRLCVEAASEKWISFPYYRLTVPSEECTNGHFILECRYEGDD